jgi:CUB domain
MWMEKLTLVFGTIGLILCDNEVAKVKQIKADNSTINYIKYMNNGLFTAQNQNMTSYPVVASQPQQTISQCGGIFKNLQNLIESPKFISPRPICNLRCEYQIVSPYICENEFHVQFLDFAIDSSRNCEYDRVIINHSEVMCGKIIGVKKFRTQSGVLNITFSSKSWDLKEGKGFRLLITRLPCVEDSKEDQTEVQALEPSAPEANDDGCFHVNSSYSVQNPFYRQDRPIYGVPSSNNRTISGRQDIPVIPLPIYPPSTPFPPFYPPEQPVQPPFYPPPPIGPGGFPPVQPPFYPPPPIGPGGVLPPQFLPQCCRNNYNQNRFLLISQGFPANQVRNSDCIFVITRSSPNVCRLRIVFKYFLLDDPQAGQFGCINNFIEMDGQRICGCKSNFVYETQWGFEPKVIRLRTVAGQFMNTQGFVFDVIQEACPFKIQANVQRSREKRFILHSLFNDQQFGQQQPIYPVIKQIKSDIDDKFKSKFFQSEPNYVNNVCVMNHMKLFQMKLETLGIPKQYCFPSFK